MHDMTRGPIAHSSTYVLYLDFDGVLHHEAVYVSPKRGIYIDPKVAPGAMLFEWAPLLIEALDPHPEVRIVLSTSWCRQPGYSRAKQRLPFPLRERVIGGTFHRRVHGADQWGRQTFAETTRALQILADVSRRKPKDWLAIDDDVDGWPIEYLDRLVPCDGSLGLSSPATLQTLKRKLDTMMKGGRA